MSGNHLTLPAALSAKQDKEHKITRWYGSRSHSFMGFNWWMKHYSSKVALWISNTWQHIIMDMISIMTEEIKDVSQLKGKTLSRVRAVEKAKQTHTATLQSGQKGPQLLWGHIWGTQYTQRLVLLVKLEGWRSYSVQSHGLLQRRVKPHTPMSWPAGGKMAADEVFTFLIRVFRYSTCWTTDLWFWVPSRLFLVWRKPKGV